jgi:hypothetical protein
VIKDRIRYFEEDGYQKLLRKMVSLAKQKAEPVEPTGPSEISEDDRQPEGIKEIPEEYVQSRNLNVAFDKAWLADEDDVERYLNSLRDAFLTEIRQGRKVQI